MLKIIKLFATLIASLVLLLIIAIFAFTTFVDPNDFKPQIIKKVYETTGRQLKLNGKLHWSFFPWLGLQINDAQLSNAKGFDNQSFAQIKQAEIRIRLAALLKRELNIGTLAIDGLQLNLSKNKNGVNNWQDLMSQSTQTAKKEATANHENNSPSSRQSYFRLTAFAVRKIEVTNSQINWNNQENNQRYDIKQLNITSQDISLGQAFPIDLQFILQSPDPKLNTDIKVKGIITLNSNELSNPLIQGELKSKKVQVGKFEVSNISSDFNFHNGKINLNPINAKVYQGSYNGNLAIDTNGIKPKITTNSNFSNIQAEPLMQALAGVTRIQLTGRANLNTHLTLQGGVQTLNGTGQFALGDGVLKGIDLPYWVGVANSLIHKQRVAANNSQQTRFDKFTGSFVINNGVLSNNDLLILATNLRTIGKGTANLVTQQLNYQLTVQSFSNNQTKGVPVPITLNGNFSNIQIRPNVESIIQQQLKEKAKIEIGKQLQNSIGKTLGEDLSKQLNSLFH